MILVDGLTIEIGHRSLLKPSSFRIDRGQKVGLVGQNGAGKSSIVSVLIGEPAPELATTGTATIDGTVGVLPQSPVAEGLGRLPIVRSHLLSAKGLDDLEAQLDEGHRAMEIDPSEERIIAFSAAEEQFRHAGGYEAESSLARMLAGVGLGPDTLGLTLNSLSGGERRRIELVRALFGSSESLILDEPTNHLDRSSKVWLMDMLTSYDGALLIVSHDLALLDRAITRILHLERGTIRAYKGTYSQYVTQHALEMERTTKVAKQQDREVVRLSTLADSMRGQSAKRAKTAHALEARVERIKQEKVTPITPVARKRVYKLPDPPPSGVDVLAVDDLWKAYGDKIIFTELRIRLSRGERLIVIGHNGAGKSTLMRMIVGTEAPDVGTVVLGHKVAVGWYAQEHENLRLDKPALENVGSDHLNQQERRRLMGLFGLSGDIGMQRTGSLSGGERTKLSFAQLVAGSHNLLILDEPTNNLDPASRIAAGAAFGGWKGTMIVVSHDRDFVKAIHPTHALLLPEGKFTYWKDELLDIVEERRPKRKAKESVL